MNNKKQQTEIVLIPQFLDDWSDKCNLPVTKMREVYDALKETLKEYVDEQKEVRLSNFMSLVPRQLSKTINFHNINTGKMETKKRELPFVYSCRLSTYLKYPYPYPIDNE